MPEQETRRSHPTREKIIGGNTTECQKSGTNDNIWMSFTVIKVLFNCQEEEKKPMKKMNGQVMVPYHIWNDNQWTTRCPHQDMVGSR
ncbi:hypothetical protein llap_18747 [Limosa lapponica baueri]|uniref:Uncharacterized protein n=1 Tax=Limosa lapponica baueri TaxID=1758121 RepID=A0A2I0TAY1_LIMLA|nr:hypothetical protein llap_18747 [Limosa lapponica baueri]